MGLAKQRWMEQQEQDALDERAAWIREQLRDQEADEASEGWDRLAEEYDLAHPDQGNYYEDDWEVRGKSRIEIFSENISASQQLLELPLPEISKKNLLVMLHAHVVTSVEAYLSSTFIEVALRADVFMRKLVETDPEFAKRKFTIQELFTKRENLRDDLRQYLKDLIFHDIAKVREMYKAVLDIDFGEVKWLFRAVMLRHDCVHRAGYDKDGNEAPLTSASIAELIKQCVTLVGEVEKSVVRMPADESHFWRL